MKENGLLDKDFNINDIIFNDNDDNESNLMKYNKLEQKVFNKIKLREKCIACGHHVGDEEQSHFKDNDDTRRVSITALDIDWLFIEDNFEKTLDILANTHNDVILISK